MPDVTGTHFVNESRRLGSAAQVMRLRENPQELAEYCVRVAASNGIPLQHVIKDFWITEALRAMVTASVRDQVHLVFKGGTSLSKGYRIIHRFSEDIDLLCLAGGGQDAVHSTMRRLHAVVAQHLGIEASVDATKSAKGRFRVAEFVYPGQVLLEGATPEALRVELSTWGGAIPSEVKILNSLLSEHLALLGVTTDYEELSPFGITVLRPERTLVEKLVILHDAAMSNDELRQRRTARHYYDVWCLLGQSDIRESLESIGTLVVSNEVYAHNMASKTRTIRRRPMGGFAASRAFIGRGPVVARDEYAKRVLGRLIWPGRDQPTFDECLTRVQQFGELL